MSFDGLPREVVKRGWKACQTRWAMHIAQLEAADAASSFEAAIREWKGSVSSSTVRCARSPSGECMHNPERVCVFCGQAETH